MIIITITAYLALLFTVAWLSGRRAGNATFFTGNRRSPWFVVAVGMIAAPMSGVSFVSVPGMVGASGWAYLQMAMGFVAGYMVIAFVLVPLLYRRRIVSVYEYLGERFGGSSHRTGAWFFFASKMLGATVRIYLVCLVLQMLVFGPLGVPFAVNAGVMMALVWLYTFRGGVRSIVWTDALKTLCLVASVGLSIWFISKELGLDFGGMAAAVRDSELSRVWFFDDVNDRRYFFKQFFSGLFVVVAMTGLDQDMMQLPLSCRSPRDSQKNFVMSGVLQFVVIAMFLSLGVLLNIFVSERGLAAPASGDELFPFVATGAGLPAVVGVVFALGLIASTYSAAGSALTALTTSFTVDILGAGLHTGLQSKPQGALRGGTGGAPDSPEAPGLPSAAEARLSRTRRTVHACMAAAMVLVIMAFRALSSTSVIDAVYVLASYTYGPILGMFVFGMATRRRVRDRWVPLVAVASPALCLVLDLNSGAWFGGYRFGYEILMLNALFTIIGLTIIIKKNYEPGKKDISGHYGRHEGA
ncbi:MAG: sodium:solute symporter [Alistipes sp.]|jgi:Na+/proline symporter|nr:sodium:solute symporter [Alistipes sp.]